MCVGNIWSPKSQYHKHVIKLNPQPRGINNQKAVLHCILQGKIRLQVGLPSHPNGGWKRNCWTRASTSLISSDLSSEEVTGQETVCAKERSSKESTVGRSDCCAVKAISGECEGLPGAAQTASPLHKWVRVGGHRSSGLTGVHGFSMTAIHTWKQPVFIKKMFFSSKTTQ